MTSIGSPLEWGVFAAVVIVALAVDLGVFNRTAHRIGFREAAVWTAVWTALALGFNGLVLQRFGPVRAAEFFQGWLLELALSVDNVFVFILILQTFRVAEEQQHRVLFWGILGAVVARGVFILAGAALVTRFQWVMYILGAFLIFTAGKIVLAKHDTFDPAKNPMLRLFRRLIPTTDDFEGSHFVVRRNGRLMATPLLAVLALIEVSDVMFAVDSIPAILGVTTDVFVVFTSNIFAILGLRSLFFLVAGLVRILRFLKIGVALILAFIGAKILIASFVHVPVLISLGVIAGVLGLSALASFVFPERPKPGPVGD